MRTIALLAILAMLAACDARISHVNVYPAFGPRFGDGGHG